MFPILYGITDGTADVHGTTQISLRKCGYELCSSWIRWMTVFNVMWYIQRLDCATSEKDCNSDGRGWSFCLGTITLKSQTPQKEIVRPSVGKPIKTKKLRCEDIYIYIFYMCERIILLCNRGLNDQDGRYQNGRWRYAHNLMITKDYKCETKNFNLSLSQ